MTKGKRLAGLLLCLALVLPVFAFGAEGAGKPPALNTREHIVYISGKGPSVFAPDESLTRAQAAKILCSLLEDPAAGSAEKRFSDVENGQWFSEPVNRLASLDVLHGYEDGTFRPAAPVSRAEYVTMLSQFTPLIEGTVLFGDVPQSHWAWKAVSSFAARGWVKEDPEGMFHPDKPITRAEAVTILNAVLGRDASAPETLAMLQERHGAAFTDVQPSDWYYAAVMEASTEHSYTMDGGQERWTDFTGSSGNEVLDRLVQDRISACTTEDMTQYEKLSACYCFLRDQCTYLSRPHYGRGTTDWAEESAVFLLEHGKGNCYCYAAAFTYLARALGYDAQPVSGGMGVHDEDHAWVMIGGRIFDPEIEYAHLYRYRDHKYYDCFDIDPAEAPFIYHFPT